METKKWRDINGEWYSKTFPDAPAIIALARDGGRSYVTGKKGGMSGMRSWIESEFGSYLSDSNYFMANGIISSNGASFTLSLQELSNKSTTHTVFIHKDAVMGFDNKTIRIRTLFSSDSKHKIADPELFEFLNEEFPENSSL